MYPHETGERDDVTGTDGPPSLPSYTGFSACSPLSCESPLLTSPQAPHQNARTSL